MGILQKSAVAYRGKDGQNTGTALPALRWLFGLPCFFRFEIFFAFLSAFPFFSKDFKGSAKTKPLPCLCDSALLV